MVDDQPLWGYPEVAAHLGTTVSSARRRKSRGSLPEPDDTTVPDRPRWNPATFDGWKPIGRGFRTDLHSQRTAGRSSSEEKPS